MPPFPGPDLVGLVQVSPPSRIPEGATPFEVAEFCAAAYRGAVEAKWPELGRCWAFARSDIAKSRAYGKLKAVGEKLRAHGVAPSSWCLFSADVWREYGVTAGPPTADFVFSEVRFEERFGWFEERAGAYAGGRVLYSPAHLELAADWKAMWADLLRENPRDRPSLLSVVDRHFPGDSFEQRLAAAKAETRSLQKVVRDLTERGCCAWLV